MIAKTNYPIISFFFLFLLIIISDLKGVFSFTFCKAVFNHTKYGSLKHFKTDILKIIFLGLLSLASDHPNGLFGKGQDKVRQLLLEIADIPISPKHCSNLKKHHRIGLMMGGKSWPGLAAL